MISNLIAFGMPGGPEMILIFLLVLLLFGAKKLPQLAKGVGKATGEFKKAQNEFKHSIQAAEEEAEKESDDTPKVSSKEDSEKESDDTPKVSSKEDSEKVT